MRKYFFKKKGYSNIGSKRGLLFLAALGLSLSAMFTPAGATEENVAMLHAITQGDHRSEDHKARDIYRHPVETLNFFGVTPEMSVVEISPGGAAWYTEIIAPYLKNHGEFYAAHYPLNPESERSVSRRQAFVSKFVDHPEIYGKIHVTEFGKDHYDIAPEGSVDRVLTFRNVHSWMGGGYSKEAFAAFFKALKPGGVLGLVEHRGNPDKAQDPKAGSGYVREDVVIKMAEEAGFELAAKSEVNANPKDSKDYVRGVWTLPPVLRLGWFNKGKYQEIGESDRMTLKFVKPAGEGTMSGEPK